MDNEMNSIRQKVKRELSDFLGIGIEDIEDESDFSEDFHMSPTEMADFIDILGKAGLDVEGIELTEVNTFGDLIESITEHV